ncbi:hypothetical protein CBM2585_B20308 [Cupriavidus taiwanensis]|nr:hypothetical protein CBM2585_B20308 [Cupriavidus taiwanensis]
MSDGHRQRPCLAGLRLALRSVDPPPRTRFRAQGHAFLCLPWLPYAPRMRRAGAFPQSRRRQALR